MRKAGLSSVLVAVFVLLASCASAADLSGTWTGSWLSNSTGHKGPLRAEFTRINPYQYHVAFRGRFFKIIPFRYAVTLNIVQEGDVVVLQGSQHLGRLFGTFHYYAEADSCRFVARYSSCKDQGQFVLSRCCP